MRWISADSLTSRIYDPPSLNKYTYVRNDPVNKIDPDGKFAIDIVWALYGDLIDAEPTPFDPLLREDPASDGGGSSDVGGSGGTYNPNAVVTQVNYAYKDIASLISKNNLSGQSEQLITCIAFKESMFNAQAKNPDSSASGLMQITRAAAIDVNPMLSRSEIDKMFEPGGKIFDPDYNIAVGSAYLGILMDRTHMDLSKAVAAYGTGADYAKKVLDCEAGLKALKPGDDPYKVLRGVL
jgi:hypothetical protein